MQKVSLVLLTLISIIGTGCTSTDSTASKQKLSPNDNKTIIINHDSPGNRNPEALNPDLYPEGAKASPEPVIRSGRYNLASAKPTTEQQDLMSQISTTNIPANVTNPTVKEAMGYVMIRSGYELCPIGTSKEVRILYTRPLPAAHYKLGPITLRNALQVLVGPAYQVQVDEVNRKVCFTIRDDYQLAKAQSTTKSSTTITKASTTSKNTTVGATNK